MPVPITRNDASAAFFDAAARGELLIRRCPECGQAAAPHAKQCPACAATGLGWEPASGAATLVSWAVPRDRDGTATTVAGLVELAEGPWLRARLVDADPDGLAAGLPLDVAFEQPEGGETVPVFRPARA